MITMKHPKVLITESDTLSIIKQMADTVSKEAFYICDLNDIARKYYNWIEKIPRVTPYYAVKCNPHPDVLKTLAALGANFDCASRTEIKYVLSIGVSPDRIIFANPAKLLSHLKYAREKNVKRMTFDCEEELMKIRNLFPEAQTVLRIRYDDPDALYPLGGKFGCDPDTEAEFLLRAAKSLNMNVIGISFHIGSSSNNPKVFREAIKKSSDIFKLAKNLGFKFQLLDIGGGYLGEIGTTIDPTAAVINQALIDFFPSQSIEIISEPGRYFVSSAFTLATNIHTVKSRFSKTNGEKYFDYFIDDGVYSSFIAVLFDEKLPGFPLKNTEDVPVYQATIWGPTCDSFDKVMDGITLPQMEIGDWLIFPNMGAYTISISSKFNGFASPKVYTVASKNTWKTLNDKAHKEHMKFTKGA